MSYALEPRFEQFSLDLMITGIRLVSLSVVTLSTEDSPGRHGHPGRNRSIIGTNPVLSSITLSSETLLGGHGQQRIVFPIGRGLLLISTVLLSLESLPVGHNTRPRLASSPVSSKVFLLWSQGMSRDFSLSITFVMSSRSCMIARHMTVGRISRNDTEKIIVCVSTHSIVCDI